MSEHAKLSPSSSDRWLACPASIVRAPETEDEGSDAAHEGTAAHAFAAHCLENNCNGMTATFPAEYKEYDSPDLRMHIQTYLEYVMRLVAAGGELAHGQGQFLGQIKRLECRHGLCGTGLGHRHDIACNLVVVGMNPDAA